MTANGMFKGCSIRFLSVYPLEGEVLYPPLTYLKPNGAPKLVWQEDGTMVEEIEVEPILTVRDVLIVPQRYLVPVEVFVIW
jgi:hypothetical protein